MIRLVDFIKNVEDEVFEAVQNITLFHKEEIHWSAIWVHQFKGKVCAIDSPCKPGFVRQPVYKLCTTDNDLRWIPDKKAIKKWIEEEVLLFKA